MTNIKEYRKATSLEEAWTLNQKKRNRIIGGMLWLRLMNIDIDTAIDLSGLGLDKIEETEGEFQIGSMVTLHSLETNEALLAYTDGQIREALKHIVGVQFRNMATVGGTIYGKYGFSDLITLLLALDAEIILYKGGRVSLLEYLYGKHERDIVTQVVLKKTKGTLSYLSVRAQKTDFPTLTCAAFLQDGNVSISVGARPGKATLVKEKAEILDENTIKALSEKAAAEIKTGSNLKGSAAYRTHLVKVLVARSLRTLGGKA